MLQNDNILRSFTYNYEITQQQEHKSVKQIYTDGKLTMGTNGYDCGPCSIKNFLSTIPNEKVGKYAELIKKSVAELLIDCKSAPNVGTNNDDLLNVVSNLKGIESYMKENAQTLDISIALNNGYHVIVNYFSPFYECGHFALIEQEDEKNFYLRDSAHGFLAIPKKHFQKFWHDTNKTRIGWMTALKCKNETIH